MFTKFYEKLKKFIIKNYKFLIFLVLLIVLLNLKTSYIVKAPGGIMSLSDRVYINDKKISDNYYTTYVKVMDGKVAAVILSYILPNWDLEKYEEYSGHTNLTYDELNTVEKLMMDEGNNIAIITAFKKAGINYKIIKHNITVYYKYDKYDNDLEIGDIIYKCNNKNVNDLDELHDCISKSNKKAHLSILRDNKEKELDVNIYDYEDMKIIGIGVLDNFEISSDYNIKIKSSSDESGSSGGFMTALSIYSELSDFKLPKNKKIAGTGTIKEDETIGKIDGIKYKLLGAEKAKVDVFFVPKENYKEAIKIKKKHKLKLKIVKVSNIDDAINYLNKISK